MNTELTIAVIIDIVIMVGVFVAFFYALFFTDKEETESSELGEKSKL